VLLGVGILVQVGKLSEIKDLQAGAGAFYAPLVIYISLFGALRGIIILGRPYALAPVQVICFLIAAAIYKKVPDLFEWWDKMTRLFDMLS
jgi:hypothetical protein